MPDLPSTFALVFPGQGSQSIGMMKGFADSAPVREAFAEASAALGEDLWAMAETGPESVINSTVNTQPLMLTAGVATWRAWRAAGGPAPSVVAGHSLGEYAALVAAGSLALADAVRTRSAGASVLLYTGRADEQTVARARAKGVQVLWKPTTLTTLVQVVERAVAVSAA